jgi:L-asparaginase
MISKPKILLIYTGGTIGMIQSENGTYAPFSLKSLIDFVPQVDCLGIEILLESFDKPLDSALIGPKEWLLISQIIIKNYDLVDGFVVLHGTDTMAYTSSALSFLLRGVDKPVILTGAQIPVYQKDSDGIDNFINALEIAKEGIVKEVALWFHKTLYKGACVTKSHSKDFKGFSSPNHPALASKDEEIKYNNSAFCSKVLARAFFNNIDTKVIYLNLLPSLNKEIQSKVINENSITGVVLSAFGSGTVPLIDEDPLVIALKNKNIPILVITECYEGGLELGKYEAGAVLQKLAVISGGKITKEAAITKMMVGLGNLANNHQVREYLSKNQVGEFQ